MRVVEEDRTAPAQIEQRLSAGERDREAQDREGHACPQCPWASRALPQRAHPIDDGRDHSEGVHDHAEPTVGRAGRLTFRVHNGGAMHHEFVVLRTSAPAYALRKGDEANDAGNVGKIPGLAAGATKTLRLTLKPGHYALICNMPGHYVAGQRVDFTGK
jgi:uncharacterized cupredoxin-like copper-binding protein